MSYVDLSIQVCVGMRSCSSPGTLALALGAIVGAQDHILGECLVGA